MNDGPSKNSGLREEWSLLVHSFLEQPEDKPINPKDLTLEQVNIIKKDLSAQRKSLNQKIENIKGQIEHLTSVIENLELVGSDTTDTKNEIDALHVEGEKASSEMTRVENKINKVHELTEQIVLLAQEA